MSKILQLNIDDFKEQHIDTCIASQYGQGIWKCLLRTIKIKGDTGFSVMYRVESHNELMLETNSIDMAISSFNRQGQKVKG